MDNPVSEEILFSGSTLTGHGMTGAVYLLLPVIACRVLRKYQALELLPLIFGAGVYFLSVRLDDLFVYAVYAGMPQSAKAVAASLWAGVFEETGRFLMLRSASGLVPSYASAVSYGTGHAGLECLIRAVRSFGIVRTGLRCNAEGLSSFTAGLTQERAAAITEQLSYYASQSLLCSIFAQINALCAFLVHLALTLLLFHGIREGKPWRTLALAILLHCGLNELSWASSFSGEPILTPLTGILCSAGILVLVMKRIDGRSVLTELRLAGTPDDSGKR
ncbi:MAG: YhfC family intramembrane metalloprotease [Oscillospiraceae bacterium]|nr:YhfC family intramembrane metalloprotease [Oscillospiraceae bacterium]